MKEKNNGINQKFVIGASGAGIVVIVIVIFVLNYFKIISLQEIFYPGSVFFGQTTSNKRNDLSGKIIARVGMEDIYQKDLDTEISFAPPQKNIDIKKQLLKKLINDSIILQGAADDKFITLDESVFNSVNKDYMKRIAKVREAENKLNAQVSNIKGTVITIWFYNNEYIGPLGYEKSKSLAYQKILKIYNDIKSGKINIKQAVEAIHNDDSLSQLDSAYKTNASINFNLQNGEGATFDDNFNKAIWKLDKGELSDIYALVDENTELGKVEVLYAFAQVSDKINKGKVSGFDNWLKEKRNHYEISY